jgi:hypothetical protein
MRTTLTLDDDVAAQLAWLREERKLSLRDAVNMAIRKGLVAVACKAEKKRKPFETPVHHGGKWLLPEGVLPSDFLKQLDDEADMERFA